MADFFDEICVKTSEYPQNFLPAGTLAIDQASDDGDCTVKGFYDTTTGEYHIQEVVYNKGANHEFTAPPSLPVAIHLPIMAQGVTDAAWRGHPCVPDLHG